MPLSDLAIRNAKPTSKSRKLFDGRGLFLIVTPAGGKWWRFKYRFAGKEKLISLGTYPDTSPKLARDRRDKARELLAKSMDPSHVRRAANEALLANSSFETVAREWFAKKSPGWAPSHSSKIIRLAKRALEIFSELMPVTGNCQYVFPGIRTSERPMSENTVNAALRRLGYSGGEMTGHGFRSMVSTLLNEQGWSPDEIERMLSHAVKNTWPKNRAVRQA